MGSFGVQELLLILLILVLIFGASKLPQLGRGLGEGIRNFKKGIQDKNGPAKSEDPEETSPS